MSKQPLPRNVKVLGAASFVNDVASEMAYPLLPTFLITVLGGTRFHLGIVEGLADSVSSLVKLWAGSRSDRVGQRKGYVSVGYTLATLARPVMAVIIVPWQLFLARIVDRIGKGIRTAPRDAMIADATTPAMRGRAFGFHRAMDHLGAAVGPLLATLILLLWPNQLRLLFCLTLIPGIVVVCLVVFLLQEPRQPAKQKEPFRLTLKPFDRRFRVYLVALLVFTLGNSSDAFLLVRAGELGVPVSLLPILWFAFHVFKSSGSLVAGRVVDVVGPFPLLFIGWTGYALAYLAFGLAMLPWQVWVLFLVYGIVYAAIEPAEKTLVANLAPTEQRGLAYGWFNFAMGIAGFPSSLLFGFFYEEFGALIAFGWGASTSLIAVLLLCMATPLGLLPRNFCLLPRNFYATCGEVFV